MMSNPIERDEIESVLAVRQELGASIEPALVDSFAEKITAEVQRRLEEERRLNKAQSSGRGMQLALGIVSLVMAIPLTAVTLGMEAPFAMFISWVGVVLVNFAFAFKRHES